MGGPWPETLRRPLAARWARYGTFSRVPKSQQNIVNNSKIDTFGRPLAEPFEELSAANGSCPRPVPGLPKNLVFRSWPGRPLVNPYYFPLISFGRKNQGCGLERSKKLLLSFFNLCPSWRPGSGPAPGQAPGQAPGLSPGRFQGLIKAKIFFPTILTSKNKGLRFRV